MYYRIKGNCNMKVKVNYEKEISRCYHECPYFTLEGGPGPVMVCGHPSLKGEEWAGHGIISHPDCDTGFPKNCPLRKEQ